MRRPLVFVLLSSLLLVAAQLNVAQAGDGSAVALAPMQRTLLSDAVQSFRDRRFAAAYGRFVYLADLGHAASAQLALVMVRQGPALFGSDWSATPAQQQRWNDLVVDAARDRPDLADDVGGD